MSSSSSYHPEESEDASDSEFETRQSTATRSSVAPSSRSHGTEYSTRELRRNASRSERRKARNRTRETAYWDLRQQLPGESVGAYTELLEETNSDSSAVKAEFGGSENYNVTQNGIAIWTTQEKEIFFDLLDKKGRNGVKEIAQTIGTKSELEVQEHLKLLHRGLERQHLRDRHARTVILGDVPAATEVRDNCGRELDKYSELLCLEEQYLGDVAGRKRHYDAWIIDRGKAEEIDEQIDEEEEEDADEEGKGEADAEGHGGSEDDEDEESEEESEEEREPLTIPTNSPIHLSASLFTMSKWIRLSERFFMNPSGARLPDNWTKIAYPGETPSITADAFTDLYAIAMSLTRRLVHSSLFFAMSRIRQMRDSGGRRKARLVKSRDVRTALDVLNMKQDRSDYWIGLARRCHLDVMDARHQRGWKNIRMSHNEVEDYLSGDLPKSSDEKDKSKPSQEHAGDPTDNDDNDSVLSDVRSSSDPIPEEQLYLTFEDEHAEAVDQKASKIEEQRLWKVLSRPAPVDLDPEIKPEDEDLETLRKPSGERKTKKDLVDWRDRTLYRGEWEEYGNDVFDVYEELSENRRKRRRIAKEPVRPASPVGTISDEDADVEMDETDTRDDEEIEEVNTRAIKHEGEDGREEEEEDRDEDMDEHEESVPSIGGEEEEVDQKPIIRDNEEEPQDQGASRNSNEESEYESENDFKPPHQAIKYDPSRDEDEGSGSMSEYSGSESESDDDHQPQQSTMKREASEHSGSESESTETEQKPNIPSGSQEHHQRIKHEPSEYSGSGSESESDGESTETEHKPNITAARDDNESRSAHESEDNTRPKEEGDESTDEGGSMSSNQHDHSSSEDDNDTPYYYQQTSQDHGLVKRE